MKESSLHIDIVTVGVLQTNCYIVMDTRTRDALIIDPGAEPEKILSLVRRLGAQVRQIVNTHGHVDHISANGAVLAAFPGASLAIFEHEAAWLHDPKLNCSVYVSKPYVSPAATVLLREHDTLSCGDHALRVLHTPGHTPGGICLITESVMFSGDTLFAGTIGRCDLPGGNETLMMVSLNKLKVLSPELIVYPGHGPATVLKRELQVNPYLNGEIDA